jgi:DNA primase small subunit
VKEKTRNFLQKKFQEYYEEYASKILPPTSIEKREFGFLLFRNRMMTRHRSFLDISELRRGLINVSPSDVYYSSAYYTYPTEDMDRKRWQGADLIFDIDADHLETDCKETHILWVCEKCERTGFGNPPSKCQECEGKIRDTNWVCENCLEATKKETIKLLEILTRDFGFLLKNMLISFSGNRGYHVHVENEDVKNLDQLARKEIVDYIKGTGLEASLYGLSEKRSLRRGIDLGPDYTDPGWGGRLARAVYDVLTTMSEEELTNQVGLTRNTAKAILLDRDNIVEFSKRTPPWFSVRGVGDKSWDRIIQFAIKNQAVDIDTVVTSDIHRLIRLPETLHGKTGFRTAVVSIEEIEKFDPLSEAQTFEKGTIKIRVSNSPKFRLGIETYGPFKEENVELPTAVAVMLICKGVAVPQD